MIEKKSVARQLIEEGRLLVTEGFCLVQCLLLQAWIKEGIEPTRIKTKAVTARQ